MSQERLSGLTILSTEKEMLEELKYKNLISNFASQKARKKIGRASCRERVSPYV